METFKHFFSLMFLGMLVLFTACSGVEDEDPAFDLEGKVSFGATILEVQKNYLLVSPKEGESELRSADRITVATNEAILLDEEGREIEYSMFKEGMEVEIVYDGMIAESYPAQISTCYEVRIVNN